MTFGAGFGVATEELAVSATRLRTDGQRQREAGDARHAGATPASACAVGRAARAVQAFVDTLDDATRRSATGLTAIGDRLAAAADAYDTVESRLAAR